MKLLAGKTWYTVKPGEAHPRFWRFHKWIYYLKVEPLCCHNQYKIQICTPACLISSEFFTISHCLYSVSIEWTKFSEFESDMKFHNYIPRVCAVRWSLHMPEGRDKSEIRNHRRIQVSNNKFLDGIFRNAQGPGSTSKLIHSLKPFEFLKENFVQTIPHIRLKVLEITENVMLFQQSEISIC